MKVKKKMKSLSCVRLFATPWTVAYQAPPSMGFSRQECWSGLPFPSPGDLPNPGIEPRSPALQADALQAAREKQQVTDKGNPICLTADLSAETLQARREWQDIFKVLKAKKSTTKITLPGKDLIQN